MATLTVLKFNAPNGADEMLGRIQALQKQELIQLQDAAIVSWPEGKKKPKTRQLTGLGAMGALTGAFWGLLFGLLFFIPFLGMAIGAALGGLAGHFADFGIDNHFINEVKQKVTPGTSALFLMTSGAVQDRVVDALRGMEFEIISTNLSQDQEEALRAAFAEE
jgi:uncharacterized membrane protein